MTINFNDLINALQRYFDAQLQNKHHSVISEKDNIRIDRTHKKILYRGDNIKLARQLVNEKYLKIVKIDDAGFYWQERL